MNTTTTAQPRPATVEQPKIGIGTRTQNLTYETPLLLVAVVVFVAVIVARPELALLLLGIPAAVILGVATITSVASLLAR